MYKSIFNFMRLFRAGFGRSKRYVFYVLQTTYFKLSFLDKKNLGDRLCFNDDTKILFSLFQKINILNKLKQYFESGPWAAVCQPLY